MKRIETLMVLAISAGALVSCSSSSVPSGTVQGDTKAEVSEPVVAEKTKEAPAPVAAPKTPYSALMTGASRRFGLVELAPFADHVVGDDLIIDMGREGARKYINGGWRTGWSPTAREANGVRYLEANGAVVRTTFKPPGAFDTIGITLRAPRYKNRAKARLNGVEIGRLEVSEAWERVTLEVPQAALRAGENVLELEFSSSVRLDGRAQIAHVARIDVLNGGDAEALEETAPPVRTITLGGRQIPALAPTTAGSLVYRLEVPAIAPALGFVMGAAAPGGRLSVRATRDGGQPKTLIDAEGPATVGVWEERSVDLSAFAGAVIELEIAFGGTGDALPAFEGGVYGGAPVDDAAPPTDPDKPARNVLVYLVDTLRYDKIGAYNKDSSVATPNFDAFAKESTLFESAYVTENWTKPSTASILTGLYSWSHRTKDADAKLPERVEVVSEHLKARGFATASYIANGYVSRAFGFDQGWNEHTNYIREGKVTDADRLVDDALAFVDGREREGERWFTYVHTIDPHVPYSAPGPFKLDQWKGRGRGKYGGQLRAHETGSQIAEIKSGKMKVDDDDRAYLEALYDGEVAYNDQAFGRLIEGLKARGVYDDTVVVVLINHNKKF